MSATIVFDLDGTLVHTAPDLVDSVNHTLATAGLEPVTLETLLPHVGHGGRAMLERTFAMHGRRPDRSEIDALLERFMEHYASSMPGRSEPFEGAPAALERLAAAGFRLAVCTNKLEGLSRRLLERLDLAHRFQAICGADTFAFRKPDPRHLIETIVAAGGDPECAVMVGDSATDVATAKAAGIPVVAVTFGYSNPPVVTFEPSAAIHHYDELTVALARRLIAAAT
jgi:phosphoglycolate phosphatase